MIAEFHPIVVLALILHHGFLALRAYAHKVLGCWVFDPRELVETHAVHGRLLALSCVPVMRVTCT